MHELSAVNLRSYRSIITDIIESALRHFDIPATNHLSNDDCVSAAEVLVDMFVVDVWSARADE